MKRRMLLSRLLAAASALALLTGCGAGTDTGDAFEFASEKVVAAFLGDQRIRYLKNERNSGAAVSRNRALRDAKGRWIAFLDSDDLWVSEKLEKQIEFMEKNGYSFSYTNYEEIDMAGQKTGAKITGPKKSQKQECLITAGRVV